MLEILVNSAAEASALTEIAITRSFVNNQPRSHFAFGYNRGGNKALMVGGLGGGTGGQQFPGNGILQTVEGTSSVSAYIGSAYAQHRGVQIGANTLYFGDGTTNATTYNSLWRYMVITGGDPVARATMPGPVRHSSVFAAYSADTKIFRGFGFEQVGAKSGKKCHSFDIATNAWSDLPDGMYDCYGTTAQHYNGKIYVLFGRCDSMGSNLSYIQIFDIATQTWSLSTRLNAEYFPNGTAFGESVIVDDVIWYFSHKASAPVPSDAGTMVIIKYHISSGVFSYHYTKQAARYGAPCVYDAALNEIKVYSGSTVTPLASDYLTSTRNSNTLVFKAK